MRLLETTDRELPLVLAEIGDELLFHVATNPEVRARVVKGAGPKKRGRASPQPGGHGRRRHDHRATATRSVARTRRRLG